MSKDKKEATSGAAENLRDALVLRPEWEIKQKIGEAENIGGLVSDLFFKPIAGTLLGGIFG